MDRFDDDTLLAELRELRPQPRPEFTADLDERAAAGFPRRSSRARGSAAASSFARTTPFARLLDRLRSLSPGRLVVPAVGTAIALLAVATVAVAISSSGGSSSSNPANEAVVGMVPGAGESGRAVEETSGAAESGGDAESAEASANSVHHHHHGGENSPGTVYLPALPSVNGKGAASKSGTEAEAAPSVESGVAEGGEHAGEETAEGAAESEPEFEGNFFGSAPPSAVGGHRDVERGTSMILGTKPGEVASASAKVFEAVHAAKGYVLHSSVQSGTSGPTGATFSMLIPNRHLDDALAAFSQIAEVRQRHDATNDITAPTVGATEELRDSNASIEGLLKELGDVESEEERESVEARLREERRHHAAIRASLEHLHKRASMAEVSLRIVTADGAGVAPPPSPGRDEGGWGVGDALHDAGHILTIAAGIVLIALAVLGPIALIALLVWLANRFRVRRLRERALG